jgi:hypothetical protein
MTRDEADLVVRLTIDLSHARDEAAMWRLIAHQAIHLLHTTTTERGALRAAYYRTREELRQLRGAETRVVA